MDDPGGSVVMPPAIWMTWSVETTLPSAMVPSWHERHIFDAPVGWPGRASRELLS